MRNFELGSSFKRRGADEAHKKAEEMEVFLGVSEAMSQAYVRQNSHTPGSNSHKYWSQVYRILFNRRKQANDPEPSGET